MSIASTVRRSSISSPTMPRSTAFHTPGGPDLADKLCQLTIVRGHGHPIYQAKQVRPPRHHLLGSPGEPVPIGKGSHVYLIDGSGYIFRAFHALPPLTRPSDGLPVGAVHGFCAMLWKLLQDARKGRGPTHLAVIFDASEKTFRNEIYKDYKAHRPPAPEELVPQFPLIRDAVKAFNIPCLEQDGYEADDIIATYAKRTVESGGDVTIVSSDKDLMQLVRPGISMLDTM